MATSGSFTTTGGFEGRKLLFSWTQVSQSIDDNSTTISWSLKGTGGDSSYYYKSGNFKVVINGATVYYSSTRIKLSYGETVASGTTTITHNTDGTKSFTASAEAGIYYTAVNSTGSATFTLDTIPRASQPSCETWPDHTDDVGEFGDTIDIFMNRASSSFTHTVRYEYGNLTGTIATGVTNDCQWTIPTSFMDLIPNDTTGRGRIYVDTYCDGDFVGTKYCGFIATVPASVKPTCRIQVLDATDIKDTYGNLIKGKSKLYVKATGTSAYSSPIKSYKIIANGVTYTDAEITTGVLIDATSTTVSATVTDNRDRTSTAATATFPVLDYSRPTVGSLAVHRCNEDGIENDQGEHVKITFSASVTSLNGNNSAFYTVGYKKSTNTDYTYPSEWENVDFSNDDEYKITDLSCIFSADADSSYDVVVSVADNFETASRTTSASTGFTLMNWGSNGTSMAIGKVAEKASALEIALKVYDRFDTHFGNGLASYGGTSNPIDADTTIEHHFLTTVGTPTAEFWHVLQLFYSTKTESSNRIQMAMPYNRTGPIFKRYYINGQGWSAWESEALQAYPVGSIYMAYNHTNPSTLFGGTWVRISNSFLWATESSGTIGQTGGEKTHTLTADEMPSHAHYMPSGTTISDTNVRGFAMTNNNLTSSMYKTAYTGGGAAHNNMPPYIQISVWRRTA